MIQALMPAFQICRHSDGKAKLVLSCMKFEGGRAAEFATSGVAASTMLEDLELLNGIA